MVILLYGLSGAGKTTIAKELQKKIRHATILDGDEVRSGLNKDLGMSLEDRKENVRRIAEVAKLINGQTRYVIISVICPTVEMREMVKGIIGDDLYTVYVSTPLEVCQERDAKGLYAKLGNEMSGIDSVFETGGTYDVEIDTTDITPALCAEQIINATLGSITPKTPQRQIAGAQKRYNHFQGKIHWKLDYQYKFAYPVVAKCASTQMGQWTASDNDPIKIETAAQNADNALRRREFGIIYSVDKIPEDFVKFSIYRDPLERFYSACHFPGYDAKDVIKEFTEFADENGVCKDQHMRRQSDTYKLEDVDYVVNLADLNDFLDEKFNFGTAERPVHKHPVFNDIDLELSEEEMQYVKDYYAEDWKIGQSEKVWKNPKKEEEK